MWAAAQGVMPRVGTKERDTNRMGHRLAPRVSSHPALQRAFKVECVLLSAPALWIHSEMCCVLFLNRKSQQQCSVG